MIKGEYTIHRISNGNNVINITKHLISSKRQGKITDSEGQELKRLMKGMSRPEFYLALGFTLGINGDKQ